MNFSVIKVSEKEYREGDIAVRETAVFFFGIPLYKSVKTSTNNKAVAQLTILERPQIVGFKN